MSSNESSDIIEIKTYWPNRKPRAHVFLKNNKYHGVQKRFHNNGVLKIFCLYKNDKKHGEYKYYFSDGELEDHYNFKNDKLHGECKSLHPTGGAREHCFYKDGVLHGEYRWFREDGELIEHCFYNNGTEEDLSEYTDDIENITDTELMNITLTFGNNFFASNTFTGTPL